MAPNLASYFWVMLGGALGTGGRLALSAWALHAWGPAFPWGTLIINVSGSFAISLFAGLTGPEGRWLVPSRGRQFFLVGICGGYTTFSSFTYQTLALAHQGDWARAAGNVVGSVVLCLIAVWLGGAAAAMLNQPKRSNA